MRIAVIDIAASMGGAKSILVEFYDYLVTSKDRNEWFFFLSEKLICEQENIHIILMPKIKKNWIYRLAFDMFGAKKIIKKISPDAILNFQNTTIQVKNIPQYLYLQQSIPFQKVKRFSFFKKEEFIYAVYQNIIGSMIKKSIKKATGIIVQTNWMREAVLEYTTKNKVHILPPTVTIRPNDNKEDWHRNIFFYPANGAIYKNHTVIIKAAERLNKKGITDFKIIFTLDREIMPKELPSQIECIGLIPRVEVLNNYKKMVLLFPSYIETYGMPLAEARISGSVIIAARTPFAEEILDGYENAFYFDAFDVEALEKLMEASINGKIDNKPSKESIIEKSTWATIVKEIEQGGKIS